MSLATSAAGTAAEANRSEARKVHCLPGSSGGWNVVRNVTVLSVRLPKFPAKPTFIGRAASAAPAAVDPGSTQTTILPSPQSAVTTPGASRVSAKTS